MKKMVSPSWRMELFFVMWFCSSGLLLAATSELQALMAFKSTVDDDSKVISDWGNGSSLCSWTGISCREGNVVSLSLPYLGLQGILAPELGSLLNLEVLNLANNQFSSSIPFQLWKLQNLETLDLSSNLLTGTLPSGIQNLKRIQKLDLSSNSFSGRLDTALFSCSNLQSLDLHSNSFTGEIPNQISGLSKLQIGGGRGSGAFVGGGGAAAASSSGAAAAEAPASEEKKEEKEESDDDMGFSLSD